VLSQRGATSTKWSFAFPAPASGGTFEVFANAVNVAHRSDVAGSHSTFSILPSVNSPQITLSNQYVSPGGTFSVTGAGFQSGEVVNFSVDGNVLAKPVANASGAVPSTKITLPGVEGSVTPRDSVQRPWLQSAKPRREQHPRS